MRAPPDYEKLISRRWQENRDAVRGILADGKGKPHKNLMKKIKTFVSRFGFTDHEVKTEIKKNRFVQASFAVDPRKQRIEEDIALQWLEGVKGIKNLEKLPAQGDEAFYVTQDSGVRAGANLGRSRPTKSLDFRWRTGTKTFYAMHKRTTGSGGAQGSVKREMQEVLKRFLTCEDKDVVLVMILDGDFWDRHRESLQVHTRGNDPRSFAVPIEGVPEVVGEYCQAEIV